MTEELSLKIDQELAEIKKQLIEKYSPKPQFEVDRWDYLEVEGQFKCVAKFSKLEGDRYYYKERQYLNTDLYGYSINDWLLLRYYKRPATPEEVKQALVKEAERKNYKVGTKIKPLGNYPPSYDGLIRDLDYTYFHYIDSLQVGGAELYRKGQWAEIIKEEVIKICGKEVEFINPSPIDKAIKIDGVVYHERTLKSLKSIMEKGQIKSLNVGCSGQEKVTLETINSILKKLN